MRVRQKCQRIMEIKRQKLKFFVELTMVSSMLGAIVSLLFGKFVIALVMAITTIAASFVGVAINFTGLIAMYNAKLTRRDDERN